MRGSRVGGLLGDVQEREDPLGGGDPDWTMPARTPIRAIDILARRVQEAFDALPGALAMAHSGTL